MGNFLGCFGASDDSRKRRKQRENVGSREQRHVVQITPATPQRTISAEAPPANLVSQDICEEKLSLSARKRVTFDENVRTYEHVSVYESTETLPEKTGMSEKEKSIQSSSSTEDGSVISSVGSYPCNHRYQNCKESDDEGEEFGDSDLDDDEDFVEDDDGDECFDNEGKMAVHEIWSEAVLTASMESSSGKSLARVNSEEVDSPLIPSLAVEEEERGMGETKGYVRDRSAYVHPVLNPVENLSQWKALKSKAAAQLVKPLKENLPEDQEAPRISFSLEPKQNPKFDDDSKVHNQEIAVNASLSNWLVSPETTSPATKTSFSGFETVSSANPPSGGSNSARSFEDRPILGALTVEELKQLSASSASPRRSPSRSPDEVPIIGTVGTYWNDYDSGVKNGGGSRSKTPSSFKGIPNTTSKYREDKRVNWHSTPFETRLERALLNQGAAEA
ncbi:PREDICTED: protein JASON [Ipomoea nil]|uniref:protein JASON n=1 Tax=Ipomoea nil TaxID=35883 RepID=UPI000901D494|nr:PREDICTED: protein JASON [Ipomoea nil]